VNIRLGIRRCSIKTVQTLLILMVAIPVTVGMEKSFVHIWHVAIPKSTKHRMEDETQNISRAKSDRDFFWIWLKGSNISCFATAYRV
jgi:hypothetical protein